MARRGDDFRSAGYVPARGDVVHLNWAPSLGHEMTGPHYGLVLSQTAYNIGTGLAVVSPITSKAGKLSGFELEVIVGRVCGVVVLSELRSLDYQERSVQYEDAVPSSLIDEAVRCVRFIF